MTDRTVTDRPVSGRPSVTLKWAQTLDGRAAAADGSSQWITGPEARADVYRRRSLADAILVGTGTLLADDPALTARAADGTLLVPPHEQPIPVVVGKREIPAHAQVLTHPALASTERTAPIQLPGDNLADELASLTSMGIRSVFVEGGPAIISSLLRAGLADELLVYLAPALLGGPRLAIDDLGVDAMADITRMRFTAVEQLGVDLRLSAVFSHSAVFPHNADSSHNADFASTPTSATISLPTEAF
ncbi:MAG: RibD family protein [Leucobacter sp.]